MFTDEERDIIIKNLTKESLEDVWQKEREKIRQYYSFLQPHDRPMFSLFNDMQPYLRGINANYVVREYGDVIEFILPLEVRKGDAISVFIKRQDGYFVITDNGWVIGGIYDDIWSDNDLNRKSPHNSMRRLELQHLFDYNGIKLHHHKNKVYLYITIEDIREIPRKVMRMGIFIQTYLKSFNDTDAI